MLHVGFQMELDALRRDDTSNVRQVNVFFKKKNKKTRHLKHLKPKV